MLLASGTFLAPVGAAPLRKTTHASDAALARLERQVGGRLGVALLDPSTGHMSGHRVHERFAMCSTFKLPLAGAILREIDQGRLAQNQFVPYDAAQFVPNLYAPVTKRNLPQGGMGVLALAEATQTTSDNVAANLLLRLIGGPEGLTAILRGAGDRATRLDRYEPQMNRVGVQDLRDTTTPLAMAHTTAHLLTSDWLSAHSRALLTNWMEATTTGQRRIRAGLPQGWRSGDKTGTGSTPGMPDKYNDVAVTWPVGKTPRIICAFYETTQHHADMRDEDEAVLAEVGRIAVNWINAT